MDIEDQLQNPGKRDDDDAARQHDQQSRPAYPALVVRLFRPPVKPGEPQQGHHEDAFEDGITRNCVNETVERVAFTAERRKKAKNWKIKLM